MQLFQCVHHNSPAKAVRQHSSVPFISPIYQRSTTLDDAAAWPIVKRGQCGVGRKETDEHDDDDDVPEMPHTSPPNGPPEGCAVRVSGYTIRSHSLTLSAARSFTPTRGLIQYIDFSSFSPDINYSSLTHTQDTFSSGQPSASPSNIAQHTPWEKKNRTGWKEAISIATPAASTVSRRWRRHS